MSRVVAFAALLALAGPLHAACPSLTNYTVGTPDVAGHPNDTVVVDNDTGLMWKQCPEGVTSSNPGAGGTCDQGAITNMSWPGGLAAALASSHAGYTDWRLPNMLELHSIADMRCHEPAINTAFFPGTGTNYYWSSTSAVANVLTARAVYFLNGQILSVGKTVGYGIRLVRGGHALDAFASNVPVVTAVSPDVGPAAGGGTVTLTGAQFAGAMRVTFDATDAATFAVVNGTTLTVTPPAHAPGTVDVRVTTPNGTSEATAASRYTYFTASTVVDSLADGLPAVPLNCAVGHAGTCRLRDAIAAAQPGDTVSFAVDGTIALAATLALDRDVRIDGSGRTVAIDGGGNVTVFRVASGATARIERVTIRNGRASETCAGALRCGGGIRNAGNLTLSGVTVAFNAAADIGAGVYNDGTLRLVNGTLSDNAAGDGGGLYNAGSAQIANSTFGDNIAASGAGVRNAGGGSATLVNTIVDAGCAGIVTDLGGNLDGDGSCGFATANGSMSNAAIGLGPLQDNGGATPTRLPGPTSAAIGFGRDDACAADGNVDQRGIARPQGVHCDAGATEVRLHALTASVTTSNGAVASADGRIAACTRTLGDCEAEYSAEGEGVPVVATLVVVPTAHYHLVAWGGDCAVDGTVAMSADRHCTAAFAIDLRSVGGTVTGLAGSGLDVRLNGGDAQAVTAANPAFAFAPLPDLSAWAVTVAAQPVSPWQTCAVDPATASGTLDGADVTDVAVHCTTNAYTVGGTVAGFAHADTPLVLRLDADGAQTASVASGQAGFAFAASVASGTAYVVSIAQQPQGHVCAIDAGASGTVHGENIADVRVTCVRLPRLALAIADGGDYARYDSVPAYLVRLTNTGGATQDVAIAATLSPAFDSDAASWVCDAGTLGATCTPFGNGPLADTVRLPADSDLVFVLGAPLRAMTPETTATVTVGATGAAPVSDVDTLVIFRDGFEPP